MQAVHRHNPYGKREKGTGMVHPIIRQAARPNHHTAGQARPWGQGTNQDIRRVGIGQGDLPHTKVETSASRMHGNHKEQNGSHSLNRWKERLALQHRHAGMSTGSEPCTLRGILSQGAQALMTRLGPSHERGPGTQPHIGPMLVSEFSVRIYHTVFYQCYDKYNVFNRKEDNSKGQCTVFLSTGQWPNITYVTKSVLSVSTIL